MNGRCFFQLVIYIFIQGNRDEITSMNGCYFFQWVMYIFIQGNWNEITYINECTFFFSLWVIYSYFTVSLWTVHWDQQEGFMLSPQQCCYHTFWTNVFKYKRSAVYIVSYIQAMCFPHVVKINTWWILPPPPQSNK